MNLPGGIAVFLALLALPATSANRDAGSALYATRCASCHGANGQGSSGGPPLVGVSASAIHFMLDTGRMPATSADGNEIHRQTRLSQIQIAAIVHHVLSFSPHADAMLPQLGNGDPVRGRALYAENCEHCHGAGASGASVGANNVAPSLRQATVFEVAEAIRAGPGIMPRFGHDVLSDRDVSDIAHFVNYMQTHANVPDAPGANAGGITLGFIGPVAEGFIAWLFGLGALLVFIRAIGTTT